jgi:dihydroxyacetone kinase DhaKLM complex PTS-EIIA-like component DhaM
MANFDDVTIFGNTSLSDLFKQIHKNNKDIDKQIGEFIDTMKPMATSNAGSAVMLMPTVKDLIDVNVKNNEQLIKMAGIVQRASTAASSNTENFFDTDEIQALLEEQRAVQIEGAKLLEQTDTIQHKLENK